MTNDFLVSIVIITYNQEEFIEAAILGVLSQVINFPVEVIIADDCSIDKTEEIVLKYVNGQNNFFQINYYKHQINKGPTLNAIWAHSKVKGKYVAICEGDDYWTDTYKLVKQVNFLEQNIDFSFCFHSVEIQNSLKKYKYLYPKPPKSILSFKDILYNHYIPTCSLLYRRELLPIPFPKWMYSVGMTDIPIELFLSNNGKAYYFEKSMAVYRINRGGLTHNISHIKNGRKSYDYLYSNLRNHFGYKYYFSISFLLLKNKLGYIKDYLGFNKILKNINIDNLA